MWALLNKILLHYYYYYYKFIHKNYQRNRSAQFNASVATLLQHLVEIQRDSIRAEKFNVHRSPPDENKELRIIIDGGRAPLTLSRAVR